MSGTCPPISSLPLIVLVEQDYIVVKHARSYYSPTTSRESLKPLLSYRQLCGDVQVLNEDITKSLNGMYVALYLLTRF